MFFSASAVRKNMLQEQPQGGKEPQANEILGYIKPLTKELQSPNIDLMTAYKEAREVVKKRVANRQQNRANIPSQSIEEHYGLNLFYPFNDHVTSQLNTRFVENSESAMLAAYLIPSALFKLTKEKQEIMVSWYREDLPEPDSIDQEVNRWKVKNQAQTVLASTAKETLDHTEMQY